MVLLLQFLVEISKQNLKDMNSINIEVVRKEKVAHFLGKMCPASALPLIFHAHNHPITVDPIRYIHNTLPLLMWV